MGFVPLTPVYHRDVVAAVADILERIRRLPEADRALLERELDAVREAGWLQMAGDARRDAQERRLTERQIEQAIEVERYGRASR
jgi:hypothetical protein